VYHVIRDENNRKPVIQKFKSMVENDVILRIHVEKDVSDRSYPCLILRQPFEVHVTGQALPMRDLTKSYIHLSKS
jgi:hypothetical protein